MLVELFSHFKASSNGRKSGFPLPDDSPLGGVITIEIGGENLGDWLEAATWHSGRRTSLGELVMNLLWMLTVKL